MLQSERKDKKPNENSYYAHKYNKAIEYNTTQQINNTIKQEVNKNNSRYNTNRNKHKQLINKARRSQPKQSRHKQHIKIQQ